ncbi:hypothetical protein XENOCAPTIV_020553 [Xenoophorus captivus]|uniref:Uncharacterized protein n=1 Tax=Xenoophorus captivus TaxID=1517983 RepID=A0ABV0RD74_9TELE
MCDPQRSKFEIYGCNHTLAAGSEHCLTPPLQHFFRVSGLDTKGRMKRSQPPGLEVSSALRFGSRNELHNHMLIYNVQCFSLIFLLLKSTICFPNQCESPFYVLPCCTA